MLVLRVNTLRIAHHIHRLVLYRCLSQARQAYAHRPRSRDPLIGLTTPVPDDGVELGKSASPFYFEAGYAAWAKRPTRPFPPPFFSPPSGSFSDPLSTHNRSLDRRSRVNGQMIRGVTNGDDALLVSDNLIGTNDGVGAWHTRERGCAPLWSRLILHFLALAAEKDHYGNETGRPDLVKYLDEAYVQTKEALSEPNEWFGTTTTSSALVHFEDEGDKVHPVLYVAQLGDSKVMVVRPANKKILFETEEQWHYFDCPRQLGTNSPDTPKDNAILSTIHILEDDIVLAMSDGVTDNLWNDEISETAVDALESWREKMQTKDNNIESLSEGMRHVAQELVLAARKIAEDPFAGSPFMERAIEEGLAIEGGKPDDISVVAAICKRRPD
ncbi:Hypothetical protein R9X50_00555000 [Acrodontium crateriforme]|uniref:Protein phosphatase n=1 Tax=Acrodontium crateriforme TaxID=150365 RepID=A0AAQ3R972_9PEZI|nr:Hypothetical protein R9X50_00555000 [Acrodontium crateriforme]